jgi:antibiotic biosynthesis monooxygenase (ABM) superfamily enzyme
VLTTPGVQHVIVAALIVGAVTWLIMPHYTRLISRWLYS